MSAGERQSIGAALRRVRLVAGQTLGEALRLRLTLLLLLGGGLLVGGSLWLRQFNFGVAELKFIADFGLGVIGLAGTLLAALAMAHLYFRGLEGGLAAVVITRAVRRSEYLWGQMLGVAALLALSVTALAVVLGAIVGLRGAQLGDFPVPLPLLLQACALIWLKVTLVAAMTLLVCSYASSALFASCAGLLLALAGHLRAFTATDGWRAGLRLWPDLSLFDPDLLLSGLQLGGIRLLLLGGYWAVFMIVFVSLAAYVFRRREL